MTTADELLGEKCEFKAYRHSKKKEGRVTVDVVTNPLDQLKFDEKDSRYALVINRFLGEKNELEKTTLQINSRRLLEVFQEVVGSYPTVPEDFTSSFQLESPFQILIHYWDDLDFRRRTTQDLEERMHLNLLFDFMNNELGPQRQRLLNMIRKNSITYLNAWCLFRPGDLVYSEFMGHPWLLECQRTAYEESTKKGPYFEVHCTYTDHDGTMNGESDITFTIYQKRTFAAENPAVITGLLVYPRKFVKEGGSLEKRLRERGQRFLRLQGVTLNTYNGQAQYLKEPDSSFYDPEMAEWPRVWLPYMEQGRVIVDRKTFQEDQYSDTFRIKAKEPDPVLCPPYENGYSLRRKEWCRFFVNCLHDIDWNDNVWNSLIIGEREKLVLRSLVTSHTYPEYSRDKSLQKGKGLVVLLHGTPGSGKTLTAETAAEGTRKALITTSLGELNKENRPYFFEYRLKVLLQYATIWKAVVLMDEADVFLESRDDHGDNSTRNALVAVFLKELEYFSGIIFLTTNRVKTFDWAMRSRIHLALEYTPPNLKSRQHLWQQVLDSIPTEDTEVELDEAIHKFASNSMNGREIVNTVHTARTIARFQNLPLQIHHVETVLDVWHRFDESLKKARMLEEHSLATKGVRQVLGRTNSIIEKFDESNLH